MISLVQFGQFSSSFSNISSHLRYTREIPAWVSNWGPSGFPVIVVRWIRCHLHLLWSECEDKTLHGTQISWTPLFCIFFCVCVCGWQKPKDLQCEPMTDDAITRGGIRRLGSPLYIHGSLACWGKVYWKASLFNVILFSVFLIRSCFVKYLFDSIYWELLKWKTIIR